MSQISILEALDVSIHLLLFLVLAHHLGILNFHWMPCLSTPSCLLLLAHLVALVEALLIASPIAWLGTLR